MMGFSIDDCQCVQHALAMQCMAASMAQPLSTASGLYHAACCTASMLVSAGSMQQPLVPLGATDPRRPVLAAQRCLLLSTAYVYGYVPILPAAVKRSAAGV
jgi:hypothetical protein